MRTIVLAEGQILQRILSETHLIWSEGLAREPYARWWALQLKTAWGRGHLRRMALVDGDEVLASVKEYLFDARIDGRVVPVVGLGAVFTLSAHRGKGHARELVERMLTEASRHAELALLFSEIGPDYYAKLGFDVAATSECALRVAAPAKRGAPATMIRSGEDRDLVSIAALGRELAAPFRFHLERDADLIQYGIVKKRLLAGLGPAGMRELQFFVAEEGGSAVAYVVVSVDRGARDRSAKALAGRDVWMLEECGDRDPSGARVGAILQALLAREPATAPPLIRAWLPPGFLPPQISIEQSRPSTGEVMMLRGLKIPTPKLSEPDVLYWHGDLF